MRASIAAMSRAAALKIVKRLQDAGFEAYFAGGCVRDRLLGVEPADYDVATEARPPDIERLFSKTIGVGRQFGILLVPEGEDRIEVATFRSDGDYRDGRRPESVTYTTAKEDALRRDFTVNAMFEDPVSNEIHDWVGGRQDLQNRCLRAVGDPALRFAEDHLRLLRGVRFAARLGFEIEKHTLAAMSAAAGRLSRVSAERLGDETTRMLCEGQARRAFELLDETQLLGQLLPEMLEMKGCEQSKEHHPEGNVFEHTLRCIDQLQAGASPALAFGVLLHDIAKPRTAIRRKTRHTFYGHTSVGSRMAGNICRRLRRSNELTQQVEFLVDQHLRHCALPDMKRSTLARFLRQDGIELLLDLCRMDALGSSGDLTSWQAFHDALEAFGPEQTRPVPFLNGRDLMRELAVEPGPEIGRILHALENAQLEERIASRSEALELAKLLQTTS